MMGVIHGHSLIIHEHSYLDTHWYFSGRMMGVQGMKMKMNENGMKSYPESNPGESKNPGNRGREWKSRAPCPQVLPIYSPDMSKGQ
jgi:hypothetical protein